MTDATVTQADRDAVYARRTSLPKPSPAIALPPRLGAVNKRPSRSSLRSKGHVRGGGGVSGYHSTLDCAHGAPLTGELAPAKRVTPRA